MNVLLLAGGHGNPVGVDLPLVVDEEVFTPVVLPFMDGPPAAHPAPAGVEVVDHLDPREPLLSACEARNADGLLPHGIGQSECLQNLCLPVEPDLSGLQQDASVPERGVALQDDPSPGDVVLDPVGLVSVAGRVGRGEGRSAAGPLDPVEV